MRSSRFDTGHTEGRPSGPEPADGATPESGGGLARGDWPESDESGETGACLAIQIDLSAMADGELDPPAVRRALAHSDVCADCGAFAASVRSQAALHRALFAPGNVDELMACPNVDGALVGGASLKADDFLRIVHFKETAS